ncbi:MBL fold metallo-hydrolase RNA specificity domain-containing protein [Marinomonas algicola]|uniref:MBL fold metallo-hydrolase RNA specificity domain-containing protein n=1 Tax=Marinomonas algicola TaxID=2773454 RepID=UPI0017496445|nr:MBL fold metallo-hydrolase [Marinomonas algicola]
MFEIVHHGAVDGVTGSCHELKLDAGGSLLVDCGLFQGAESFDRESESAAGVFQKQIDFPIDSVQALLVTHCHIDHVGRIPYLLAAGFDGPIYATEATAHLLPLVLEDAIKVGVTRDKRLIRKLMARLRSLLVAIPYKQWFDVKGLENVRAKFQVAGHILGSAYIEVDLNKQHRVVFSGDLGAPYSPLLPSPKSPYRADTLVIESTYGDRIHESRKQRRQVLQQTIEKALQDGGTVLIPAFSIGRTQELLYEIEEVIYQVGSKDKKLSSGNKEPSKRIWEYLDIIVDSPLASKFTDSYQSLRALWDAEAKRKVKSGRHPLSFDSLLTIDSHEAHLQTVDYLKRTGRAAIVIAASGMCAGGRIQNYLKALLPDKRTDILFVGYQAKGTPGRDIQTFGPRGGYVLLDGERIDINAQIHTLGGYSAHADQKDLLNFVKRMRHQPTHIRIVHGDDNAKKELKRLYHTLLPECDIEIGR